MNRREQDAHEDLCRRLVTALNERDAARAEGARAVRDAVEAWSKRWPGTALPADCLVDLARSISEATP